MTVLLFLIASESSVVAVVCLGLRFTLLLIFFFLTFSAYEVGASLEPLIK